MCMLLYFRRGVQNVYAGLMIDGRKAAIKIVHPGDEAKKKERENEANMLVQLEHNNVVKFMVTFYLDTVYI